jgi:FtsP/CotA-like multicopper oxidase with cupredoxin domain
MDLSTIRRLLFAFVASTSLLVAACSEHEMDDTSGAEGAGGAETGGAGTGGMSGAMNDEVVPEVLAVPASDGPFETAAAPDLDPSPDVVDVALEAKLAQVEIAPERTVSLWTYNGQFPGPRIEAKVGDTVRVRLKNSLPEPTTIHWHGLRVPNGMDGSPSMQSPIEPGAEFTYEFVVPDAGTLWYHPHVRTDEQVERGLYGAFVVRGPEEPETTTEQTVVLDDLLLGEDWQLRAFESDAMRAMAGRQGNVILANGWAHPIARVERGGLHRFRFINAANARYFRLALPGHRLIQIGTDGGLLTTPREVDDLLLVPGERADVLVVSGGEAGEAVEWTSLRYNRGEGTGKQPDAVIFQLLHVAGSPVSTPEVPTGFTAIPKLPEPSRQRELRLQGVSQTSGHAGHAMPSSEAEPLFSIETFPEGEPLTATLGDVEEWTIENYTMMDHPFHLHGFRFQLVPIDEQAVFPAWRDTINVPAGQTMKFRVRFEDNPGMWMFHCHILEHAERGMMGELEVVP